MYQICVKLYTKFKRFIELKNESFGIRNRKINLIDSIVFRLLHTQKGRSQQGVTSLINMHTGRSVNRSNYSRREEAVTIDIYEQLYQLICNYENDFYGSNTEVVIAVDGTYSNMDVELKNAGYKSNKNDESVTALSIGIYNVTRNYPVTLELSIKKDERSAILNFLHKATPLLNTIFVFDRGFYSLDVVDKLNSRNLNYVFRMKKDSSLIDENNNDKEYKMPPKRIG